MVPKSRGLSAGEECASRMGPPGNEGAGADISAEGDDKVQLDDLVLARPPLPQERWAPFLHSSEVSTCRASHGRIMGVAIYSSALAAFALAECESLLSHYARFTRDCDTDDTPDDRPPALAPEEGRALPAFGRSQHLKDRKLHADCCDPLFAQMVLGVGLSSHTQYARPCPRRGVRPSCIRVCGI